MSSMHWKSWRVAGAVGAVVLAGGVLVAGSGMLNDGSVSAQTPSPSPSASPAQRDEDGRHGPFGRGPERIGFGRMGLGDFAARLAEALNIPQERVEQAFEQLRDRFRGDALQEADTLLE
jgi:hypothetical protein